MRCRCRAVSSSPKLLNASNAARSARFTDGRAGIHLVKQVAHVIKVCIEVAPRDGVLGGVVAEQGAAGGPGRCGDVVHADLVEAAGGEQIEGDVGDVVLGGSAAPAHADPNVAGRAAPALGSRPHQTHPFISALDAIFLRSRSQLSRAVRRKATFMEPNQLVETESSGRSRRRHLTPSSLPRRWSKRCRSTACAGSTDGGGPLGGSCGGCGVRPGPQLALAPPGGGAA